MRVCLIYFTGTYNTRYIAKQISESFINKGHSCELFEFGVNDFFKMDSTSFDLIGLGYPIYGFNSPKIFNQAIRKLKSNNQNYFIFKTSGESFQINNVSSRTLIKIMRKKHSNYLGEYHFLMPYNIHFRFDDRLVKQMLINDKKLLEVLVYNVSNNKKHPLTMRTIDKIYSFFVSIQKLEDQSILFFTRLIKINA